MFFIYYFLEKQYKKLIKEAHSVTNLFFIMQGNLGISRIRTERGCCFFNRNKNFIYKKIACPYIYQNIPGSRFQKFALGAHHLYKDTIQICIIQGIVQIFCIRILKGKPHAHIHIKFIAQELFLLIIPNRREKAYIL